METNTTSCCDP